MTYADARDELTKKQHIDIETKEVVKGQPAEELYYSSASQMF